MKLKEAFGATLRQVRLQRGITQEEFSLVSSRTNISLLERGKTIPTLGKLEELCAVLGVHPVTLLAACYLRKDISIDIGSFLDHVRNELHALDPRPPSDLKRETDLSQSREVEGTRALSAVKDSLATLQRTLAVTSNNLERSLARVECLRAQLGDAQQTIQRLAAQPAPDKADVTGQ